MFVMSSQAYGLETRKAAQVPQVSHRSDLFASDQSPSPDEIHVEPGALEDSEDMQAHAAVGNRAEALRVYERCRSLLSEELGVPPSPQTEAVYLDILRS
jgi:Bacterial transcriptional activator domain